MSSKIKNAKAKEKIACIAFWDDDYYTYKHDYYQVESLEHAMKLNLLEGGHLKAYDGSHFGTYEVC